MKVWLKAGVIIFYVLGSSPDFADNPRGFWEYININTSYDTC